MMSSFLHHLVVASSAIGLVSSGAFAEDPSPAIAPIKFANPGVVDSFAQCAVSRHHDAAVSYVLNTGADWRMHVSSLREDLKDKTCVPSSATREDKALLLSLSPDAVKMAMAVILMRQEYPASVPSVITTAKPLPSSTLVDNLFPADSCKKCTAEQVKELADARAKLNTIMAPIVFGECSVRTDPANAHDMAVSTPGSIEERKSIAALGPALSNCLAKGSHFTVTPNVLRGLLALSYYKVAHAPRNEVAGAQK